MITIEKERQARPPRTRKVPGSLVYEIMDGEPLYYRGYREVLAGKKTLEDVRGSSTLQSVLVNYFIRLLAKHLDEDGYYITANEAGVHINHRTNLSNDVAVYTAAVLTPDKITDKYASVPPLLVIEIDIKADLSNPKHFDYVNNKTQKLLDFGVEKVIWVFTQTQKVMVAPKGEDWQTIDWNKDAFLGEGITFNIANYLGKKGIVLTRKPD